MKYHFALAGVPNCGKTTIWNLATGKKAKTGNWPGVTAEKLSARLKSNPEIILTDIPGIYSLSPQSLEEAAAANFLQKEKPDTLIIIINGTNPEPGIYLALELLCLGIPSVIGINFCDELEKNGCCISPNLLSTELSVPVFMISAKKNQNLEKLFSAAEKSVQQKVLYKKAPLPPRERHLLAELLCQRCFSQGKKTTSAKKSNLPSTILGLFVLSISSAAVLKLFKSVLPSVVEGVTFAFSALAAHFHVSPMLMALFSDGIMPGVSLLLGFLPELFAVFLSLSLLEESGLIARLAFYFDCVLKRIGLSGKSAIPLLLGFGCTVTGVCAAKSSDCARCSKRTLSALMFVPCGARLPLLLLMCQTIFKTRAMIMIFIFYLAAIIIGIFFHLFFKSKSCGSFVLELPPIRFPSPFVLAKSSFRRVFSFVKKAGGVIVLTSVLMWFLGAYSFDLKAVYFKNESMLFSLSDFLSPVFVLTGIPSEGIIALICGVFSKEASLAALLSAGKNISSVFSVLSAVSFLLFYMIYTPCIACLGVISKEFGAKKAFLLFLRQNLIAFFVSAFFYQFAVLIKNLFIL